MSCCNDIEIVELPNDPRDLVEVRGLGDLIFTKTIESGKVVFTGEIRPYSPPAINATANPMREVGETFDFTWNVNIQPGRENITDRSISPVPSPAPDLNSPFTVTITNKKSTVRQVIDYHTITVKDAINTTVDRKLSVNYVNKVRMGFSYKDGVSAGQTLSESEILAFTGTLADNVKSVYGGLRTYNVPASAVLQYIYWVYEVGTIPINQIKLSGLPFPITFFPGTTPITNQNDNSIVSQYVIVRSVNKFGTGPISLDML